MFVVVIGVAIGWMRALSSTTERSRNGWVTYFNFSFGKFGINRNCIAGLSMNAFPRINLRWISFQGFHFSYCMLTIEAFILLYIDTCLG